ncbi:MAG: hypothetical protein AAGH89_08330 [Verrucomicrobiota bacterium]
MMLLMIPIAFQLGIDAYLTDTKDNIALMFEEGNDTATFWIFTTILAALHSLFLVTWKAMQKLRFAVLISALSTGVFSIMTSLFQEFDYDILGLLIGFSLSGGAGALATWTVFQVKAVRHRRRRNSSA